MTLPFVVGLGSHHGDDQAGWLIISRLRQLGYPSSSLASVQHPAELLDVVDPKQNLVICDACLGDGAPGAIDCFSWPADQLDSLRGSTSHDLTLGEVMDLGLQLDCLPQQAQIWTVKAESWSAGSGPSSEVQLAAVRVADAIWRDCHGA